MEKTQNLYFDKLCWEIDYWKAMAEHYKNLYDQEVKERSEDMSQRLQNSQEMVGKILVAMVDPENIK